MFTPEKFLEAQQTAYANALSEIRAGRKQSHWMWFIFPQLAALGKTDTAKFYGIADLGEAEAYFAHPVLGKRLIEISEALLETESDDPREVMGKPDDLKLRSCMTLFSKVRNAPDTFEKVLNKFYGGEEDPLTLEIVRSHKHS